MAWNVFKMNTFLFVGFLTGVGRILQLLKPSFREFTPSNPIGSNPDGTNFDLCSGSLISNKHILTSAECVLKNKNDNKKIFNEAENIVVKVGSARRAEGAFIQIKNVEPHEKAFTDGYSYNIGK